MFAGIVQGIGTITAIEPLGFGRRLTIDAATLGLDDVAVGDSIAVNGACLTVTRKNVRAFSVDVSAETLDKTAGLDARGDVNLEKSMRLGDRVDGHLVSGHIDGTGIVLTMEPFGESWLLIIDVPENLARFVAVKGSVTVNGVSLTVNRVEDVRSEGCRCSINLIPHTIAVTTLRNLKAGDRVNLEIDMIARYVERMLARGAGD